MEDRSIRLRCEQSRAGSHHKTSVTEFGHNGRSMVEDSRVFLEMLKCLESFLLRTPLKEKKSRQY
jgi:hypothetical protein